MEYTLPENQAHTEVKIKIDSNVLTYSEVLVFTTLRNVYKIQNNAFTSTGQVLSQILFEAGEKPIYMTGTSTYSGYLIVAFENGKVGKINFSSYETETKRKKLNNAYNEESKIIFIEHIIDDIDLVALSSINKVVLFNTNQINPVESRTTKGFHAVKAKDGSTVLKVKKVDQVKLSDPEYYRKGLNTVGYYLKPGDEFVD
jgi:DNA gyrase/topoisomerase IV subunit A